MRLFLDTSVLLAACGSSKGASREVIRLSAANGWDLITTNYALSEVERNLPKLGSPAAAFWLTIRHQLVVMPDVVTIDFPTVFPVAKDRPILFSALAWTDLLLTLDRVDFGELLGDEFYGMPILKPGLFLIRERLAGKLRET
jgi:predicted nucleic acid-binding protein